MPHKWFVLDNSYIETYLLALFSSNHSEVSFKFAT